MVKTSLKCFLTQKSQDVKRWMFLRVKRQYVPVVSVVSKNKRENASYELLTITYKSTKTFAESKCSYQELWAFTIVSIQHNNACVTFNWGGSLLAACLQHNRLLLSLTTKLFILFSRNPSSFDQFCNYLFLHGRLVRNNLRWRIPSQRSRVKLFYRFSDPWSDSVFPKKYTCHHQQIIPPVPEGCCVCFGGNAISRVNRDHASSFFFFCSKNDSCKQYLSHHRLVPGTMLLAN